MRKLRVFILEDDPYRIEAFISALEHHSVDIFAWTTRAMAGWTPPYDLLLLDHDLGGQQMVATQDRNTGSEFATWVGPKLDPDQQVIIHSWNPVGAQNMEHILLMYGVLPARMPYSRELLNRLKNLPLKRE